MSGDPPDSALPELGLFRKELRPFELGACAQLPTTAYLEEALAVPGRSQQRLKEDTSLTPLETACQAGCLENAKLLLQEMQKTDPGLKGCHPRRPERAVALAVESGAADIVRLLLQSRASVNPSPGTTRRPPLLTAVRDGHLEIVEALSLLPETNVDEHDARGMSALHEAVYCRHGQAVNVLLARRANPALVDKRGWTPVHLAAYLGDISVLGRLLGAGAPIEGQPPEDLEPAAQPTMEQQHRLQGPAAAEGHRQGPAVPSTSIPPSMRHRHRATRWSPLHLLLARGDEEAVKQMIAWGADPCRRGGPDSMNSLMLAISLRLEAIALLLLGLDAVRERVDEQDRRGRCALHFAVMVPAALVNVVRQLLEVNACPNLRTENGLTPIDAAKNAGIPEDSQVVKKLQVEEVVRLVTLRGRCRAQKKYEESELIRGDLRLRGVTLDIQNEKWVLPDGTWGYLAADRVRAQAQGGPGFPGN
mmetsp:Transcript_36346/g.109467  ORF Transcript_36346/g.109467 Transcript_36346/m.109467 type:complete len:476 (-) Transcript_36346:500-1927(-)